MPVVSLTARRATSGASSPRSFASGPKYCPKTCSEGAEPPVGERQSVVSASGACGAQRCQAGTISRPAAHGHEAKKYEAVETGVTRRRKLGDDPEVAARRRRGTPRRDPRSAARSQSSRRPSAVTIRSDSTLSEVVPSRARRQADPAAERQPADARPSGTSPPGSSRPSLPARRRRRSGGHRHRRRPSRPRRGFRAARRGRPRRRSRSSSRRSCDRPSGARSRRRSSATSGRAPARRRVIRRPNDGQRPDSVEALVVDEPRRLVRARARREHGAGDEPPKLAQPRVRAAPAAAPPSRPATLPARTAPAARASNSRRSSGLTSRACRTRAADTMTAACSCT